MTLTDLFAEPQAVKRLGERVFLKVPLWAATARYKPLYINEALYREISDSPRALPWAKMAEDIAECFSVTLDKALSEGRQTGWAYVDRQADPLHISLAGNLGSGRAYYTGSHFNIKGEKTPFATSDRRRFSDGFLEMERGIWEAMASNALWQDVQVGVPPVLAVLDMQEICRVEWRDAPVPRVKIIRVDRGSLDRITHVFFSATSLNKQVLLDTAASFGRHAAEKFMQRITHGAWSPGNISLDGHLMDFDTVCAVKGRAPQHSSSMFHIENYFGFEQEGQWNILRALAENEAINADQVESELLKRTFHASLKAHTSKSLLTLMGFENTDALAVEYLDEINDLATQFEDLAHKFYPKMEALSAKVGISSLIHVADFSAFLRCYPLLRREGWGRCDALRAVSLMTDGELLHEPFISTWSENLSPGERKYIEENIYPHFREHCVSTLDQFHDVRRRLHRFVERYDTLFSRIVAAHHPDMLALEARAYLANEDRFYLMPVFAPSYVLSRNVASLRPEQIHRLISLFIAANKRTPSSQSDDYRCDMRVYRQGYSYVLLDGKGSHQFCFSFFDGQFPAGTPQKDDLKFIVEGQEVDFTLSHLDAPLIYSGKRDNLCLLDNSYREKSLMFNDLLIIYKNNPVTLTDFLDE